MRPRQRRWLSVGGSLAVLSLVGVLIVQEARRSGTFDALDSVMFSGMDLPAPDIGDVSRTVTFDLAPGAAQGPDTYYVIDVDLVFDPLPVGEPIPSDAITYVTLLTNGFSVAQIKISTRGEHLRWNTVDVFEGVRAGTIAHEPVHLRYRNVLQTRGVRPGENTLAFRLEQRGSPVISGVRLATGGLIYETSDVPRGARAR